MNQTFRKPVLRLLLSGLCLALTAVPASAEDEGWLVRALGGWNSLAGPIEVMVDGDDRVHVGAKDEVTYGIELERRLTPRLGVELGMLYSRPLVEVNFDFAGGQRLLLVKEATFRPITAGLDIHLTPDRRVDLTLTPLAGYAFYDDLTFRLEGEQATLAIDDNFVWGVRFAADIALGESRWGISLGARYLDASMDGRDPEGDSVVIELDPLVVTVGLSRRF